MDTLLGVNASTVPRSPKLFGLSGYARGFIKCLIRLFTIFVITLLGILVPSFDIIMALMGSAMAFSICIILPLAFHLKLFGKELGSKEKALNWFLIVISSIMAVVGTVWVFLPRSVRDKLDGIA